MRLVVALRLPLDSDLRPLLALLQARGVPCRVSEERGEQLLWVPEPLCEPVRALHAQLQTGAVELDELPALETPPREEGRFALALRTAPLTLLVLAASLLVAVITLMGSYWPTVRWFSLVDFRVVGDYLELQPLAATFEGGQWWRLFSPMLLHFWIPGLGPLHLLMNGLWYWELGRRIEARQGGWMLLGLTLLFSLVSNLAQYLFGGPGIAGGLSGVLYGLLGHCWLYQKLAPDPRYRLPGGVVGLMLAWLAICFSGIFESLVSIANAAHLSGLLAGCVTGLFGGWLARRRR